MKKRLTVAEYIGDQTGVRASERSTVSFRPLHWHEYFEIELILEGKGIQRLNGKEYSLKRGVVTSLNPTDFHEVTPEGELKICNISFTFSALDDSFSKRMLQENEKVFSPPEEDFKRLCQLGNLLVDANRTNQGEEYTAHLLNCLLLQLTDSTPDGEPMHNTSVQNAMLYLQLHFRESPTLQQIADHVHLSPKYISELFHKETGQTISVFLSDLKLTYGAKLLSNTDLSVTDICFACGYTSIPNFLKSFKKKFGTSPLQYRKEH